MKKFKVRIREKMSHEELLTVAERQIEELRKLGFDAAITNISEGECRLRVINEDGEVYADEVAQISLPTVSWLARFVESVSVQKALDSMLPRMICIGWDAGISHNTNTNKPKIRVTHPDGQCFMYSQTSADMLNLRLELDIAETDWLLNNAIPLFEQVGWRLMCNPNGSYTVHKATGYDAIEAGDVSQVHYLVGEAEKLKAASRA